MNPEQRKEVREELREVEQQLRSWDPIGVILDANDPNNPLDEYDSYAPGVLQRLRQGADAETLARHLNDIANSRMGLNRTIEHDQKFSEELVLWWRNRHGARGAV